MNRCDICGKFRKWEDLRLHPGVYVPDRVWLMQDEDAHTECRECNGFDFGAEEARDAAIQSSLSAQC